MQTATSNLLTVKYWSVRLRSLAALAIFFSFVFLLVLYVEPDSDRLIYSVRLAYVAWEDSRYFQTPRCPHSKQNYASLLQNIYVNDLTVLDSGNLTINSPNENALRIRANYQVINKELAAVLDSNHNMQCAWLKAPNLGANTGIGHAVTSINGLVELALDYSLTLYTGFAPYGHLQSPEEVGDFFGFGCIFKVARSPPTNAIVIPVRIQDFHSTVVQHLPNKFCTITSSGKGKCDRHIVFDLGLWAKGMPISGNFARTGALLTQIFNLHYQSVKKKYMPSFLSENRASHITQYNANYSSDKEYGSIKSPKLLKQEVSAHVSHQITIGIHMRLGDILCERYASRLIHFTSQLSAVRTVVKSINALNRNHHNNSKNSLQQENRTMLPNHHQEHNYRYAHELLNIKIVVVTEDSPGPNVVFDYTNETDLSKTTANITQLSEEFCSIENRCSITVLPPTDSPNQDSSTMKSTELRAFTTLCESDVVVIAESQFSHLVAAFCSTPSLILIPSPNNFSEVHPLRKSDTEQPAPTAFYSRKDGTILSGHESFGLESTSEGVKIVFEALLHILKKKSQHSTNHEEDDGLS